MARQKHMTASFSRIFLLLSLLTLVKQEFYVKAHSSCLSPIACMQPLDTITTLLNLLCPSSHERTLQTGRQFPPVPTRYPTDLTLQVMTTKYRLVPIQISVHTNLSNLDSSQIPHDKRKIRSEIVNLFDI